jgi:leader peptidase (prepilin peptidase)/N-methyltransferase
MKAETRIEADLNPTRTALAGSIMRVLREATPAGWCAIAMALGLGAWAVSTVRPAAAIVVYGIGIAALIVAAAVDAIEQRLPNALTFGTAVLGLVTLTAVSLATGAGSPLRALAGGAIFAAWILLGALVVRDGYGLGDVKIAAACGILAGWLSWAALAAAILATQVGITLVLLYAKMRSRNRAALGPAFVAGLLVSMLMG